MDRHLKEALTALYIEQLSGYTDSACRIYRNLDIGLCMDCTGRIDWFYDDQDDWPE